MPIQCQIFISILFFTTVFHFIRAINEDSDFYLQEVRSLSELPLDKLIQIKSTFADEISKYFSVFLN